MMHSKLARIPTKKLIGFFVVALTRVAEAQSGLSVECTTSPLIYERNATYQLSGQLPQGQFISLVQYRWQQTAPITSNWSAWTSIQGGSFPYPIQYLEIYAGTFTVQAQVTYWTYQSNNNPPVIVSCSTKIPPPDSVSMPPANPVPTQGIGNGVTRVFAFPVLCQGQTCNYLSESCVVKENITKKVLLGMNLPDKMQIGEAKYLTNNNTSILDTKGIPVIGGRFLASFQGDYNPGNSVSTFNQQFILSIPNADGSLQACTLSPVFSVTHQKVDNGTINTLFGPAN